MLKRLLIILITLFGINFTSFAQTKPATQGADVTAKRIKFYPNPATTTVSFEFKRGFESGSTIQFFNFMGKKVYEVKVTTQLVIVPLTDFYRGVYIYQLRDKKGNILESSKFQVIK